MEMKRIYTPDELVPFAPIHPGEMLKDELQARGISQKKFAGIIGNGRIRHLMKLRMGTDL